MIIINSNYYKYISLIIWIRLCVTENTNNNSNELFNSKLEKSLNKDSFQKYLDILFNYKADYNKFNDDLLNINNNIKSVTNIKNILKINIDINNFKKFNEKLNSNIKIRSNLNINETKILKNLTDENEHFLNKLKSDLININKEISNYRKELINLKENTENNYKNIIDYELEIKSLQNVIDNNFKILEKNDIKKEIEYNSFLKEKKDYYNKVIKDLRSYIFIYNDSVKKDSKKNITKRKLYKLYCELENAFNDYSDLDLEYSKIKENIKILNVELDNNVKTSINKSKEIKKFNNKIESIKREMNNYIKDIKDIKDIKVLKILWDFEFKIQNKESKIYEKIENIKDNKKNKKIQEDIKNIFDKKEFYKKQKLWYNKIKNYEVERNKLEILYKNYVKKNEIILVKYLENNIEIKKFTNIKISYLKQLGFNTSRIKNNEIYFEIIKINKSNIKKVKKDILNIKKNNKKNEVICKDIKKKINEKYYEKLKIEKKIKLLKNNLDLASNSLPIDSINLFLIYLKIEDFEFFYGKFKDNKEIYTHFEKFNENYNINNHINLINNNIINYYKKYFNILKSKNELNIKKFDLKKEMEKLVIEKRYKNISDKLDNDYFNLQILFYIIVITTIIVFICSIYIFIKINRLKKSRIKVKDI